MGELEKLEHLLIANSKKYSCWKLNGRILSLIVYFNGVKFIAKDRYKRVSYENVPFGFIMQSKRRKITGEYEYLEDEQKCMYAEEFIEMVTELDKINNEEE